MRLRIEWLDGYINRIRTQLKNDSYPGLATALGAYVGETIISTYGGSGHISTIFSNGGFVSRMEMVRFRSPKYINSSKMVNSIQSLASLP